MREAIAQSFYEFGRVNDSQITEDDPGYILAFTNYVCDPQMNAANARISELIAFLGVTAANMQRYVSGTTTESDIQIVVAVSAETVQFTDQPVLQSVTDCLCCWNRTEPTRSIGYRLGNLIIAVGLIAEAINSPDRLD